MALGDNTAFFNETTFGLADEQDTTTSGVSGIKASAGAGKILFNVIPEAHSTKVTTSSAVINDVKYELTIGNRYDGKLFAVINEDRTSTQFTFASASAVTNLQVLSAQGNNSVGPTLRRLFHLGYV